MAKTKTINSYIKYLCANSAHKYNAEYHNIMYDKYKYSMNQFNARRKYIDSLIKDIKKEISKNKLVKSMTIVFDKRWSYKLYRSNYEGDLLTDEELMVCLNKNKLALTIYMTKGRNPIGRAANLLLDLENTEYEKVIQRIMKFVELTQSKNGE